MRSLRHRFVLMLLAVCLTLSVLPVAVFATENIEEVYRESAGMNPYYVDKVAFSAIELCKKEDFDRYDPDHYGSYDEAVTMLRSKLVNRESGFTVCINMADLDSDTIARTLFNDAVAHTGKGDEGDYLLFQYGWWHVSQMDYIIKGNTYTQLYYTVDYYTTAEQEVALGDKIAETIAGLDLAGKSDYQKAKAVYDYICANVAYDYFNRDNPYHCLKYTAYAALIDQKAVCQGYTLLFYRMALEAGLDARVITGYGNKDTHGWNIVKIDGSYYCVDTTWDAGETDYAYFLKGSENFGDHKTDAEYLTEDFTAAYPISVTDYAPPVAPPKDPETEDSKDQEDVQQPDVPNNPFVDVPEDKFFYKPVMWAYGNGITTGKDATHFNPSGECTRSQVVTFLWRAAGEPAPQSYTNPFPDVPNGKYYTNAVLWAVEQGITAGYKDGTFGPNKICTRSQIVTFLWRYADEPNSGSTDSSFSDMDSNAFYSSAVTWAVEQGITTGYKDGTFGPNKNCTRDQIVTFLYRLMVE